MERKQEPVVLCGASAYEEKYYLNEKFHSLPTRIQEELKIMCVLYTQNVGGIFLVEFDRAGHLQLRTEAAENDFDYDEIGGALKIKELQSSKEELFRSLELYYRVMTANGAVMR